MMLRTEISVKNNLFKVCNGLVIGSGQRKGDHVTCYFTDACCHQLEIPASQSSRLYKRSRIDATFLLPTPPVVVSGGCGGEGVT
jgi:hypothetical protein